MSKHNQHIQTRTSTQQNITQSTKVMSAYYSAPYPPASELEHYEKIYTGFTERLVNNLEKQTAHRIEIEKKVIESGIKNSARGQILAFILALVVVSFGFVLLLLDKKTSGITAIVSALVALVGVFVYGNKSKKDERIQKAKVNPDVM